MNRFNRRGVLWTAICLLVVGLPFAGYHLYDRHWLTGAERKTAIRAVYSVDGMDNLEISKAAYLQRENETQKLLANAHIAARTQKDKIVARDLDVYFSCVQLERNASDTANNDMHMLDALERTDPSRNIWLKSWEGMRSISAGQQKEAPADRSRLMNELE